MKQPTPYSPASLLDRTIANRAMQESMSPLDKEMALRTIPTQGTPESLIQPGALSTEIALRNASPATVTETKQKELASASAQKTAEAAGYQWESMSPEQKAPWYQNAERDIMAGATTPSQYGALYPDAAPMDWSTRRNAPLQAQSEYIRALTEPTGESDTSTRFASGSVGVLKTLVDTAMAGTYLGTKAMMGEATPEEKESSAMKAASIFAPASQALGNVIKGLDSQVSRGGLARDQQYHTDTAYIDDSEAATAAAITATTGMPSMVAEGISMLGHLPPRIAELAKHPEYLAGAAVKAVPSVGSAIATGGVSRIASHVVNKSLAETALQNVAKRALKKGFVPTAKDLDVVKAAMGREFAKDAAETAGKVGLLTTGIQEGGSAVGQQMDKVNAMSLTELQASPLYQQLKSQNPNASDDELRQMVALQTGAETGIATGLVASFISKASGANAMEQKLFTGSNLKSGITPVAKTIVKAAGAESVDEGLQGGAGQLIQNLITKATVDPNQKVFEGVGAGMAEGAAIGALLGGGTSTVTNTGQIIKGAGSTASKGISKALAPVSRKMVEAAKQREEAAKLKAASSQQSVDEVASATPEQVQEIVSSLDTDELTSITDAAINGFNAASTDAEKKDSTSKLLAMAKSYYDVADTLFEQYETLDAEGKALTDAGSIEEAKAKYAEADAAKSQSELVEMEAGKLQDTYTSYTDTLTKDDIQSIKDVSSKITSGTATPAELTKTAQDILKVSKSSASPKVLAQLAAPAQAILNDPTTNLDANTRKQLEDFISLQNHLVEGSKKTRAGKTTGTKGYVGAQQWYKQLQTAISSGDQEAADTALEGITDFAAGQRVRVDKIHAAKKKADKTKEKVSVPGVFQEDGETEYVVYPYKKAAKRNQEMEEEVQYLEEAADLMTSYYENAFGELPTVAEEEGLDVVSPEAPTATSPKVDTNVPPTAPEAATASPAQPKTKVKDAKQPKKKSKKPEPTVEAAPAEVTPAPTNTTPTEEVTFDVVAAADTSVETNTQSPAENSDSDVNPDMVDDTAQEEAAPDSKAASIITEIADIEAPVGDKTYDSKSDVDKKFLLTNMVKKFFKAVNTGSPFQTVDNFWEVLKGADVKEFLDKYTGKDTSKDEINSAQSMADFCDAFVAKFTELLEPMKGTDSIYRHSKPLNYFRMPDGSIHPAIVDAMAMSAFQWLVTHGRSSITNDQQQIKYILGLDSKAAIDPVLTAQLREVGSSLAPLIKQWGTNTLATAGLSANEEIGELEGISITQALGLAVANTLQSMDILSPTKRIPNDVLTRMAGKKVKTPSKATTTFIRMNESWSERVAAAEQGRKVIPFLMESSGSNSKDSSLGKPHKNPVGTMVKRSYQKIAKDIRKAVQRYAAVPMFIDHEWMDFIAQAGGDDFVARMMGKRSTDGMHKSNALSTESSNLGIDRSIARFNSYRKRVDDFIESGDYDSLSDEDKPWGVPTFYKYYVSTNNRVYTDSTDVDPQNDKYHRSVMIYKDNKYSFNPQMGNVTIGDTGVSANNLFKITFAQSMGVSTDNLIPDSSITEADSLLADPTIRAGINAAKELLSSGEEATGAQFDAILDAVAKGKEKAQSAKAIYSMAKFELALENGDTEFTSTLLYEVDGKANGPFNTLMHLGLTADKETVFKHMAQGGFLVGYDSYADWKQNPLNLDSYQTTAVGTQERINDMHEGQIEVANAITVITGPIAIEAPTPDGTGTLLMSTKDGRSLGKTVNVPAGYGAGDQSIHANIANLYINGVYNALEKANAEYESTGNVEGINALRSSLSTVLGNPEWDFPRMKQGEALSWELSDSEKAQIFESVTGVIGENAYEAMATEYAASEHNSALLAAMDNVVTETFTALFNQEVTARLKRMHGEGALSNYSSLSVKAMKSIFNGLIEKAPVYRGFFNSGGAFDEYMSTLKWETSESAPNAVGNTRTTSAINSPNKKAAEGLGSVANFGMAIAKAGVAIRALLVIGNGDAATMALQDQRSDTTTINIFDARMSTPLQMGEVGTSLNQANVDVINGYNIFESVVETYSRVLPDVNKLLSSNKALQSAIRNLGAKAGISRDALKEMKASDILDIANKHLYAQRDALLANRDEFMNTPGLVGSQFISPGTSHQINPQSEEQVIQGMVEALTEEATPENSQVDTLPKLSAMEAALQDGQNGVEGGITSAEQLVDFIDNHAKTSAKNTTDPEHKAFYEGMSSLVTTIRKAVAGTQVVYVDGQQMLDALAEKTGDTVDWSITRALWSSTDIITGKPASVIYLKGSGLVNHGMYTATAIHELLHAATANVIEQYYADPSKLSKSAREAVEALAKLQKDILASGVLDESVDPAARNQITGDTQGHEFISWGLSNQRIMQVLSQTSGKLKGAYTKFVNAIARMFGGNSKQVTALMQLARITQTIATEQANQNTTTVDPDVRLAQAAKATANNLNMVGMLEALINADNGSLSDEHSVHLTSLVDNIGNSFGDAMVSREIRSTGNLDTDSIAMLEELNGGATSKANPRGMGVPMTASEEYAFSMMYTLLQEGMGVVNNASKEMHRMYELARRQVPVEAFMSNPSMDKADPQYAIQYAAAQVAYDSIFNPTTQTETTKNLDFLPGTMTTRTNDYLVNFGALALTNESFRNSLKDVVNPRVKVRKDASILTRIQDIFSYVTQWFTDTYAKARGTDSVNARIQRAAYALTVQQSKKRNVMETKFNEGFSYVNGQLNAGITYTAKALGKKIGESTTSSTKSTVRVVGGVIKHYATSPAKVGNVVDAIKQTANLQANGKLKWFQKLMEEARTTGDSNAMFRKFLTTTNKMVEKEAQTIRDSVTKAMKNAFAKPMTKAQDAALYYGALKTDLSTLLDADYDLATINNLLGNPVALAKQIADVKTRLRAVDNANPYFHFYNNASEVLGYYMATGIVGNSGLQMNAELISRRTLPGMTVATDEVAADVKPVVDELATLYALRHTALSHRTELSNLFTQELNRTDVTGPDNGISAFLKTNKAAKEDALDRIFNGSEALAVKGYTKDTFSPFVNVTFADGSEVTEEVMRKKGYKKGKSLGVDKNDPSKVEKFIYQSDEGGNVTFSQGAMSISNRTAKGSQAELGGKTANHVTQSKTPDFRKLNTQVNPIRPGTHMAALNDADGNIIGWRYMMSDVNKESILQKSTQGIQALSNVIASTNTKYVSVILNKKIVEATHEQYIKDVKAGKGGQYIMVSKSSADPEIKALARRIPKETWADIADVYGKEVLPVRNDQQDTLLGYEDMTITNLFSEEAQLNKFNRALVETFNLMAGGDQAKAMTYARRGERGLQELAAFARRNIVLLTPKVLIGNMASNTVQLMLKGVPFTEAFRLQAEGWRAGSQYRKDAALVRELQVELAVTEDTAKSKQLQSQITRLENRMATNPAAQLAEEGFLISISEDISMDDTIKQYEYAGQLSTVVSKAIDKLPDPIANLANEFSEKRAGMGSVIAGATQMSDFASRYALVKHQTENKGIPMSQAILDAQNQFVNYDLPTGRALSYMNKMGVLWFHRYFVRMQQVILGLAKENPAAAATIAAYNMASNSDLASPLNSSIVVQSPFSHFGGPERLADGIMAHPVIHTLEAVF